MEKTWCVVEGSLPNLGIESAQTGRELTFLWDVVQISKQFSLHLSTRAVRLVFGVQQNSDILQPVGSLTQLDVVCLDNLLGSSVTGLASSQYPGLSDLGPRDSETAPVSERAMLVSVDGVTGTLETCPTYSQAVFLAAAVCSV